MVKQISKNPLRGFFDACVGGGIPRTQDMEREGFPAKLHAEIRRQVRDIHALKAEGRFADARRLGHEVAGDWLERLGPDWEPPGEAPPPDTQDPRELADRIGRR